MGWCLTSVGFDSPARWGFCGAGCKHQAAHWESLEASLHSPQAPLRPRLLPPPPLESPGTPASVEEWLFFTIYFQNLTKLTILLNSAFLHCVSFQSSAIDNIWQHGERELLHQETSLLIRKVEQWWSWLHFNPHARGITSREGSERAVGYLFLSHYHC